MTWNQYITSNGVFLDLIDLKWNLKDKTEVCLGSMYDLFEENSLEKDLLDLAERVSEYGFCLVSGPEGKRDEIWVRKSVKKG